jgi:hypothetical protein
MSGAHGPTEPEEIPFIPPTPGAAGRPPVGVPAPLPMAPKPSAPGRLATGAEAPPQGLVNVTVRGYVLDYAPPTAGAAR